jgi:hypothetical protein
MRNKDLVLLKLEKIDSSLRGLNFHIGRNERDNSYKELDKIKYICSQIVTLLNTETQD